VRCGLLPSPALTGSGSAGLWPSPHSQRGSRSPEALNSPADKAGKEG
jgi:hypothetical protein